MQGLLSILVLYLNLKKFFNTIVTVTRCFYGQRYFFNTASVLLFHEMSFQILLWCCLIQIRIFILRHVLYLLNLCTCVDLGLFTL